MAWLAGWSKRYKLRVDSSKIDSDLIDFPVSIPVYSGSGIVTPLDTNAFFDELAIISGTLFAEDFTASGTNWTHVAGTTSYTSGYWSTSTAYTADRTNNAFYFGENFDITIGRFGVSRSNYTTVYLCYDLVSANYPIAVTMINSSSTPGISNGINIYTKNGPSSVLVITDTTYDMYSENGASFSIRVCREGNKLRYKIWRYTAPEPTNWFYELDNAFSSGGHPTIGYVYISHGTNNLGAVVDNILIRTHKPTTEKKIAITAADGVTQLPVEIEFFDGYAKNAYLWTKLPLVSSGIDTVFYLYFDNSQADNVNYVGYANSTPVESVWDSGFKFVGHFNIPTNKLTLIDSTSNNVDSTSFTCDPDNSGFTSPGGGWYGFNSAQSDEIQMGYGGPINTITGAITLELVHRCWSGAGFNRGIISKGTHNTVNQMSWYVITSGTGPYKYTTEISTTGSWEAPYSYSTSTVYTMAENYYIAASLNPSIRFAFRVNDNIAIDNTSSVPSGIFVNPSPDTNNLFRIGNFYNASYYDGSISEVRISSTARSDAWLRATYYTTFNDLLFFDEYQTAPSYYYQGYIKEKGTAVQRTVRLYLRDTGELMDETISASGNGYYYLTTSISGNHFIVAFDDNAGDVYNALVLDRLPPTGIA
jgi:hypothetical protein